jgi:hypothetical protein
MRSAVTNRQEQPPFSILEQRGEGMNAQLDALKEEQDYLRNLRHGATNPDLPFTVVIGQDHLPSTVLNKARWGISHYITMRLREIDAAIEQIKEEPHA